METQAKSPGKQQQPQYDNFYTPQNAHFYSSFSYPKLNRRQEEIRLLQIDISGRGRHELISNVPLSRASSYSAVSYYSGDPQNTGKLAINGIDFNAFANLSIAIDQIVGFWKRTFPNRPLNLWTDQICINQSDPQEKSYQVAFMREIYRRADQVFISMPMDTDITPGIRWLQGLSNASVVYSQTENMAYHKPGHATTKGFAPEDSLADRQFPARPWDAMYDIIEHPWWQRAWVYQEFMVSSRAYFLFSNNYSIQWDTLYSLLTLFLSFDIDKHIDTCRLHCKQSEKRAAAVESWALCVSSKSCWAKFNDVSQSIMNNCVANDWPLTLTLPCAMIAHCGIGPVFGALYLAGCACFRIPPLSKLRRPPADIAALNKHVARLQRISTARSLVKYVVNNKRAWSGPTELSQLMKHARNCHTSQLKDKVYAFIGLAHAHYGITANYTGSYLINAVLTEAARAIITCEKRLDILSDAGTGAGKRRLTAGNDPLPSWVPDWTTAEDDDYKRMIHAIGLPTDCRATQATEPVVTFQPDEFGNADRIMKVVGVHVAVIEGVAQETYKSWRSFRTSSAMDVRTVSIAQPGDELWIFYGANQPFVLRREGAELRTILGVAMVWEQGKASSVMYGDIIDRVEKGEIPRQEISII